MIPLSDGGGLSPYSQLLLGAIHMANLPKKCFNGLAVSGATGDRQSRGSSVPVTFKKSAKKSAGISALLLVLACLAVGVVIGPPAAPQDEDEPQQYPAHRARRYAATAPTVNPHGDASLFRLATG